MTVLRAACVQVCAGPDPAPNIAANCDLVRAARADGADLILLPEVATMIEPDREAMRAKLQTEDAHDGLAAYRALARETGAWLLDGSIQVALPDGRIANRSHLIDPSGEIVARYDKIHMFDVDLPDGRSFRESATYEPGAAACLAPSPWEPIGLTICYDVRFPALYRALAQAGAAMLTVPSAFTRVTGEAHWHTLLRARAIETGCFVLAPAQCGDHAGGRQSYGHSLIVDPWGMVLADGGEAPGFVTADLDLDRVADARNAVPSLANDRPWREPAPVRKGVAAAHARPSTGST